MEKVNELSNETIENKKTVEWYINNASRLSCNNCENLRDSNIGNSCLLKIHPSICKLSILNELVDNDYYYEIVKVQKRKIRTWKCKCGAILTSKPIDEDTFMRIKSIDCPICGEDIMVKIDM